MKPFYVCWEVIAGQEPSLNPVTIQPMEPYPSKIGFPVTKFGPMGIEYHIRRRREGICGTWFQLLYVTTRRLMASHTTWIQGAFRQNPPVAPNSHQCRECRRSYLQPWAAKEAAGFSGNVGCSRNFLEETPSSNRTTKMSGFHIFHVGKHLLLRWVRPSDLSTSHTMGCKQPGQLCVSRCYG